VVVTAAAATEAVTGEARVGVRVLPGGEAVGRVRVGWAAEGVAEAAGEAPWGSRRHPTPLRSRCTPPSGCARRTRRWCLGRPPARDEEKLSLGRGLGAGSVGG
jgi:hypothetical protein